MQHDIDGVNNIASASDCPRASLHYCCLYIACALYRQSCCYLPTVCLRRGLRIVRSIIAVCLCSSIWQLVHPSTTYFCRKKNAVNPPNHPNRDISESEGLYPKNRPENKSKKCELEAQKRNEGSERRPRPAPRPSSVLLHLPSCSMGSRGARNALNKSGVCS